MKMSRVVHSLHARAWFQLQDSSINKLLTFGAVGLHIYVTKAKTQNWNSIKINYLNNRGSVKPQNRFEF